MKPEYPKPETGAGEYVLSASAVHVARTASLLYRRMVSCRTAPWRNLYPPPTRSRLAIGDWLARSRSLGPSDLCSASGSKALSPLPKRLKSAD